MSINRNISSTIIDKVALDIHRDKHQRVIEEYKSYFDGKLDNDYSIMYKYDCPICRTPWGGYINRRDLSSKGPKDNVIYRIFGCLSCGNEYNHRTPDNY